MSGVYDLAIAGGGINGAGIAADAAGRGLKVLLAEMGDLGGATSSASSKLIHGGLRYLENYQFRLVRESLQEREVLLANAPHIVWPMRFIVPHIAGGRSRSLIRAGLFIYDHLAWRRKIPASETIDLTMDAAGRPLQSSLSGGFAYWDCWVDDARLVAINARAAADRGAAILTRTKVVRVDAGAEFWRVTLDHCGQQREILARVLVNAAGPWAGDFAQNSGLANNIEAAPRVRLVKGSHIVVPRIDGADDAYLLQSADGRVVFALPFEERFTLIGTTDVPYSGDPAQVEISAMEEDYLLSLINRCFRHRLLRKDIVWRYSGVRPLLDDASDDPSAVTREYRLELVLTGGRPAALNVIGGKVTTYRRLAEAVLHKLAPYLPPHGKPWTAKVALPGGDLGEPGITGFLKILRGSYPKISQLYLARLARRYGTVAATILGDAKTDADLGWSIAAQISEREVDYLKRREWAVTPGDVLWRRTKTALHLDDHQRSEAADRIAKVL